MARRHRARRHGRAHQGQQHPHHRHHRRERLHPDVVGHFHSPNQSARLPGPLQLIVVHDTESHNRKGASDLKAIGALFMNPGLDASAHVCTDGDGHSARFVPDHRKAWHCGEFNSWSLGVEQVGFASEGLQAWKHRHRQIDETARWIARWSILYGIPIRKGAVSGTSIVRSGVVEHHWLGYYGGGHTDPGPYPFKHLLFRARHFKRELLRAH